MLTLGMIGKEVRERRQRCGLSHQRLGRLAGLSRVTVQNLEADTLKDLSFKRLTGLLEVLGLSLFGSSPIAKSPKDGLWMAAKTSSVSYRNELTPSALARALTTGEVPAGLEANVAHFLDEAPVPVVLMAVEDAAGQAAIKPAKIWRNIGLLARQLGAKRSALWA